jgi:hypothetical protein
MAVYTDEQLTDRVEEVLYTNHLGEIDAEDLKQLLFDFIDSKSNISASGTLVFSDTIDYADLTGNAVTITHGLGTWKPVVIMKSPAGDIWVGEVHFTVTPETINSVTITFEADEITTGQSVDIVIIKFA